MPQPIKKPYWRKFMPKPNTYVRALPGLGWSTYSPVDVAKTLLTNPFLAWWTQWSDLAWPGPALSTVLKRWRILGAIRAGASWRHLTYWLPAIRQRACLQVKGQDGTGWTFLRLWHANRWILAISLQEASGATSLHVPHRRIQPGRCRQNQITHSCPLFLHPKTGVVLSKRHSRWQLFAWTPGWAWVI